MINRASLIIQGPIKSYGINFNTESKILFDCFELILFNIKSARRFCKIIVLSTYYGELKLDQIFKLQQLGIDIVFGHVEKPFHIPTIDKPNNNRNQYLSTQRGVNRLIELGTNGIVIKIRTDISIDFDNLFNSLNNPLINKYRFLLIPYLVKNNKTISKNSRYKSNYFFFMLDFYFVSDINYLDSLLNLAFNSMSTISPHRFLLVAINQSFGYKKNIINSEIKFWKYQNNKYCSKILWFILNLKIRKHQMMFNILTDKIIFPSSAKTLESLTWRGSSYPESIDMLKEYVFY